MMKQMLLAQMITEGAEATQSSSALPWGTWIPSVIGLLGSLIVLHGGVVERLISRWSCQNKLLPLN